MENNKYQILKRQRPWRDAYYYQKSKVLYQLTYIFCQRFLPTHGDRTVDQMLQAARSGKQNIIEGTEDGETSIEMHIKLLNVSRGSLQELREDYHDYLISRELPLWTPEHSRYKNMQEFCREHNKIEDYEPYFKKWNDEEMANIALTLCYQTDALLNRQLLRLEKEFTEQGGIKERMYSVRTGYRLAQEQELAFLKKEVKRQKEEIARLQELLKLHNIEF